MAGREKARAEYTWRQIAQRYANALKVLPLTVSRGARQRLLHVNDYPVTDPKGGGEVRILQLQDLVLRVPAAPHVVQHAVALCRASRPGDQHRDDDGGDPHWPSHETRVFQSTKLPFGLSRHAQTCSS